MSQDFNDLRLFQRIVSAGSLSEASRRLDSSLPAMSRRLAAMEKRLGARLVDRGSRRFDLTEEGSLFLERGKEILDELDQLEAQVGTRSATPSGRLRVGAPNGIGRERFAPIIAEFSRAYPRISVELVLSDNRLDVVADELDVGLHVDEPSDVNTVVRTLVTSRRVLIASPDYLERNGVPATPDDLLRHQCICLVRSRHVYDLWTLQKDEAVHDVRVSGALLSNSAEVVHGWARIGAGIALKALWDVEGELEDGRLIEVLPEYRGTEINLYVTYQTRSLLPTRARVFIDHIASAFSAARRS